MTNADEFHRHLKEPSALEIKNQEIWSHMLTLPKASRGHGMTDKRIERLRPFIMQDAAFWRDVIFRHGLQHTTIEELKAADVQTYLHCVGNFWGMLYQSAIEAGVIKR